MRKATQLRIKRNKDIKELSGKKTWQEAKIEIGRMLALVYSAAHDKKFDIGIDIEDRWQVELTKDQIYNVCRKGGSEWEPWSSMTLYAAYMYVTNPALLMVRSGAIETWQVGYPGSTHFSKIVFLMPWINPLDVLMLVDLAIEDYMTGDGVDLFTTSDDKRLKKGTHTKDGMQQVINTGHANFDRQTNALGVGNFWGNTIHGSYIRPFQETHCNGFTNDPGWLQELDLDYFKRIGTAKHILETVRKAARDKDVIFYALFHHYTNSKRRTTVRVVHGYVLTGADYRLIQSWTTGPQWKSYVVIQGALPYLAWTEE